ncbi:MAG TPA: DUF2334 domain-containing protein [Candidatus Thermoplasmatota archaeon]|nr:DUF2334 domain-containing protein [Candidatus Thermoplasmatota archaeon]
MRKTVLFNLNFDDLHPQANPDFAGDPKGGLFRILANLTEEYPGLIVTHFTTPNWIDRPRMGPQAYYFLKERLGWYTVSPHKGEPFRLDKHPEWCQAVRQLVNEKRWEIAVHGYEHCNPRIFSHGQEFEGMDEEESYRRIEASEALLKQAGIPYTRAFRPPGWGISGGLVKALSRHGFECLAPYPSHMRISRGGVLEGMIIPPQNWSIAEAPEVGVKIAEETGVLFAKGHLTYRYGWETLDNGVAPHTLRNLRQLLDRLRERYEVRFVSLQEWLREHAPALRAAAPSLEGRAS